MVRCKKCCRLTCIALIRIPHQQVVCLGVVAGASLVGVAQRVEPHVGGCVDGDEGVQSVGQLVGAEF